MRMQIASEKAVCGRRACVGWDQGGGQGSRRRDRARVGLERFNFFFWPQRPLLFLVFGVWQKVKDIISPFARLRPVIGEDLSRAMSIATKSLFSVIGFVVGWSGYSDLEIFIVFWWSWRRPSWTRGSGNDTRLAPRTRMFYILHI